MSALGAALSRISPARGRVGEQASSGQILQVPFGCTLRPPGPEDPPRMLLVRIKLSVNEVLEVVLVVGTQPRNRATRFSVARADISRASETAIIAGSCAEPVEPLGAIGLCTGPFADDGPLVSLSESSAETAGSSNVVRGTHGNLTLSEDLILMGIEKHVLVA